MSTVFDQDAFKDAFQRDLKSARSSVVIQSPFATVNGIERIAHFLQQRISSGVRVCVFVQEPEDWNRRESGFLPALTRAKLKQLDAALDVLIDLKVHVTMRKQIHEKLAVIDTEIFWDGSLNILSWSNTKERMTRSTDPAKASAAIALHKLDMCSPCIARRKRQTFNSVIKLDAKSIGKLIEWQRESAGLTQAELAQRAAIHRNTLARIETGSGFATLDKYLRISEVLKMSLISVPDSTLPAIQNVLAPE